MVSKITAVVLAILLASAAWLFFVAETAGSEGVAVILIAVYAFISFIIALTNKTIRNLVFQYSKKNYSYMASANPSDIFLRWFFGALAVIFFLVIAMFLSGFGPAFYVLLKNSSLRVQKKKMGKDEFSAYSDNSAEPFPDSQGESVIEEQDFSSQKDANVNSINPREKAVNVVPDIAETIAQQTPEQQMVASLEQIYVPATGTVRFIRKTVGAELLSFKIAVDGVQVGKLPNKQTLSVQVEAGRHKVQVSGGGSLASAEIEVEVYPAKEINIVVSFNLLGIVKLTLA
jgi:hypothetical protein